MLGHVIVPSKMTLEKDKHLLQDTTIFLFDTIIRKGHRFDCFFIKLIVIQLNRSVELNSAIIVHSTDSAIIQKKTEPNQVPLRQLVVVWGIAIDHF